MKDNQQSFGDLFSGLRALAETSFPKECKNCGRLFETAEQFLSESEEINTTTSGLKEAVEEDGSTFIELFRNCPCGSTLMDYFSNRRDRSETGLKRRAKFGELLDYLVAQGLDYEIARAELIKVSHGDKSEILAKFRPPG